MLKTVYRSSRRDKHSYQRCDSNLGSLTPQSDALTTRLVRPVVLLYRITPIVVRPSVVCNSDAEQQLPTDKLHALCGMAAIQQYVRQTDYMFYQTIVGILVPDVLRPIPSQCLPVILCLISNGLQCSDAVGWAAGRASGL